MYVGGAGVYTWCLIAEVGPFCPPHLFWSDEMKKSHRWKITFEARCPHCKGRPRYLLPPKKGLQVKCWRCNEPFELGKQR